MSAALAGHGAAARMRRDLRPRPSVPLWVIPIALGLGIAASVLPLVDAVRLPVALVVGTVGFLNPFLTLLFVILAIPMASLVELNLGGQVVRMTEPLAGLLVLGWLAAALTRRELRLEGGWFLAPLAGMLAVMLASFLKATELGASINEALKWLELIVVFLFVTATVQRPRQVYVVVAAVLLAALVEAGIGLFQFATGAGPSFFAVGGFLRAYGTFGQPNPFAGYLATVFALSLALAIAGRGAVPRWLFLLALFASAVLAVAILTSLSRGTWLSLAVAIAGMLVVWDARSRQFIVPAALGVVVLGLLTALGALPEVITERVQAIYDNFGVFDARAIDLTPQNFAVVERMAHWQAGWYMFLAHPLLGVGIGNYAAVYEDFALRGWADPLGHAHNFYINTLAEMGIVGLAALLWVLVCGYVLVLGGLRRASGQLERALLLGALGSLIVFTVFNTFDNLLVHGMTMQLGLLFALAFVARRGLEPHAD